jgi:outer membrane protein
MKMMKKICLIALLAGFAWPAFAQQPKIGIIDMNRVFDNFYKTKAANATMKDYLTELDKSQQTLLDELKKLTEAYKRAVEDSANQVLSSEEREKNKGVAQAKFREMQEKQQDLEMFNRRAEANVREKKRQIFDKILEEIRTVINSQAKLAGFTVVLDSTAESVRGTPMVLYNNGENDLTSSVLKQLNNAAPSTSAVEERSPLK